MEKKRQKGEWKKCVKLGRESGTGKIVPLAKDISGFIPYNDSIWLGLTEGCMYCRKKTEDLYGFKRSNHILLQPAVKSEEKYEVNILRICEDCAECVESIQERVPDDIADPMNDLIDDWFKKSMRSLRDKYKAEDERELKRSLGTSPLAPIVDFDEIRKRKPPTKHEK